MQHDQQQSRYFRIQFYREQLKGTLAQNLIKGLGTILDTQSQKICPPVQR